LLFLHNPLPARISLHSSVLRLFREIRVDFKSAEMAKILKNNGLQQSFGPVENSDASAGFLPPGKSI